MPSPMRTLRMSLSLALAAALGACASAPPPPAGRGSDTYGSDAIVERINTLLREPYSDTQSVDVIYATNRLPGGDPGDCGDGSFGTQPTGKTSYGICRLNVPKRQ